MFQKLKNAKTAVLATMASGMLFVASTASAAGTDISSYFDAIDLSGIATKVVALGVLAIGICFAIKGISIVKGVVSKT